MLVFKVFVTEGSEPSDPLADIQSMVPGTLVSDNHYYSLAARDQYGRHWTTVRIPIDISTGVPEEGRCSTIIMGEIRELEHKETRNNVSSGEALVMFFFEEMELLWTHPTVIQKKIGDKYKSEGFQRNAAIVHVAGHDFLIRNEDKLGSIVEVETDSTLPPSFDVYIVQAFLFVLATPVWPSVIKLYDSSGKRIRLVSKLSPQGRSIFPPPTEINSYPSLTAFWALFDSYLTFLLQNPSDGWHPCSRFLHSAVTASRGGVHSGALALGVAVEGICKALFPSVGKPPPEFSDAVDSLLTYIANWPINGNHDHANGLKRRLPNHISQLKGTGVKDKLLRLAELGWIDRDAADKWGRLRNKTAHGSVPGMRVEQEFLDLFHAVADLFYQLVFCGIGYEGIYTAHSVRHYPPRLYPSQAFRDRRQEQIKCAAVLRWEHRGRGHGEDWADWFVAEKEVLARERAMLGLR